MMTLRLCLLAMATLEFIGLYGSRAYCWVGAKAMAREHWLQTGER